MSDTKDSVAARQSSRCICMCDDMAARHVLLETLDRPHTDRDQTYTASLHHCPMLMTNYHCLSTHTSSATCNKHILHLYDVHCWNHYWHTPCLKKTEQNCFETRCRCSRQPASGRKVVQLDSCEKTSTDCKLVLLSST